MTASPGLADFGGSTQDSEPSGAVAQSTMPCDGKPASFLALRFAATVPLDPSGRLDLVVLLQARRDFPHAAKPVWTSNSVASMAWRTSGVAATVCWRLCPLGEYVYRSSTPSPRPTLVFTTSEEEYAKKKPDTGPNASPQSIFSQNNLSLSG